MERPRIAVTVSNPERSPDPAVVEVKNRRYLEALERHGANPLPLDERISADERDRALDAAHGLLITGGTDIDPARYGRAPLGSRPSDPGRDELDAVAFSTALERELPILGICRGLQAINVFLGGSLVQHVAEHESPPYPHRAAEARRHLLRPLPGTRLHELLDGAAQVEVNSFHHQAVARDGLAPHLRASGIVAHDGGDLVEALEHEDRHRWILGVQCHPERTESSPAELAAVWDAFVAAAAARAAGPISRAAAAPRRPAPAASAPSRAPRR
jgi:putative glutamine amidotransferase